VGIDTGLPKILAFYYLGMYFNFFLPSAIGGDVFKVYYLNKETGRLGASTASVFLDRDVGMGGLLIAATLVAAYGGIRIPPENGVLLAPLFALIGVAFIAANLAIFYRPSYDLLHRALSLFKMKRADEKVERLFESVNSYRGGWGLCAVTLIISLGVQVGCAFVNHTGCRRYRSSHKSRVDRLHGVHTGNRTDRDDSAFRKRGRMARGVLHPVV
jgi:uncharacterized membrane protein YbhN (UPF0104 family)